MWTGAYHWKANSNYCNNKANDYMIFNAAFALFENTEY